jgi:hypothetical protein
VLVSVAHDFEQNGDLMADPEMTFEIDPATWQEGDWRPASITQAPVGIYREAVFRDGDGRVIIRPAPSENGGALPACGTGHPGTGLRGRLPAAACRAHPMMGVGSSRQSALDAATRHSLRVTGSVADCLMRLRLGRMFGRLVQTTKPGPVAVFDGIALDVPRSGSPVCVHDQRSYDRIKTVPRRTWP